MARKHFDPVKAAHNAYTKRVTLQNQVEQQRPAQPQPVPAGSSTQHACPACGYYNTVSARRQALGQYTCINCDATTTIKP